MDKNLLRARFRCIKGVPFAVTYWDDHTEAFNITEDKEPVVRVIIKEKINLPEMFCEPEVKFGEAYMDQKIDIEGDLRELFRLLIQNEDVFKRDVNKQGLLQRFMKSQKEKTVQEQTENVQYHYDLGNDFFRLWLDNTMSYSCAYFKSPEVSLEEAQREKIDHILRLHYAMTTDHWAKNFEKVTDQVREKYGERFVRMWRLYLVGCTTSFRCSGLDIHQLLFSKGLCNDLPLTRDYLYADK